MITLCHAAKGGTGNTVIACSRAIDANGPVLLVDLAGDVPAVLGIPDPDRPGVADWLVSDAPGAHLADLLVEATPSCDVLALHGSASASSTDVDAALRAPGDRWDELIDWFTDWGKDTGGEVVIDAGTRRLPTSFVEQCTHRWLVTRACYLALRRAGRLAIAPTGVVLVAEPGRALGRRDVERAARAPVIATIDWDPRVARSVDAGLLLCTRLPKPLHRALHRAADDSVAA